MASLLLRNVGCVITCDDADQVLRHVDIYCEDGMITAMGEQLDCTADETIQGEHFLCYPGLINTHHHL